MLSYILEEIHLLWFSDTVWHNDPEVSTESKSDPAGILLQGQTQLRRLCVNHPRVVAAIQAGREGSWAQCQTSWHPHRDTIGCDHREPAPRDCEWREWRRQRAVSIWAGKICLSPCDGSAKWVLEPMKSCSALPLLISLLSSTYCPLCISVRLKKNRIVFILHVVFCWFQLDSDWDWDFESISE